MSHHGSEVLTSPKVDMFYQKLSLLDILYSLLHFHWESPHQNHRDHIEYLQPQHNQSDHTTPFLASLDLQCSTKWFLLWDLDSYNKSVTHVFNNQHFNRCLQLISHYSMVSISFQRLTKSNILYNPNLFRLSSSHLLNYKYLDFS